MTLSLLISGHSPSFTAVCRCEDFRGKCRECPIILTNCSHLLPTPGTDIKGISDVPSKSTTDLDTPARDAVPNVSPRPTTPKAEHQHHQPANGSNALNGTTARKSQTSSRVHGVFWLLPRESRHIIGRMLEIDPKKRAENGRNPGRSLDLRNTDLPTRRSGHNH